MSAWREPEFNVVRESEFNVGCALAGAADFFLGTPFDMNPFAREVGGAWESWREGWLHASWINAEVGDEERARWEA